MFTAATFAQYVYNYQAVYPHFYGEYNTKNYTFAKEFKNKGYLIAAHSQIPGGSLALSGIKLDDNFNIDFNRAYVIPNMDNASIITHDAKGTSDRGYVICGTLNIPNGRYAFIAKFDAKFGFQWLRYYPRISCFYSITEVTSYNDIKQKYVAVGDYNGYNYANGVILCTNDTGIPVWERRTASPGKSDRLDYRQVIQLKNTFSPVKALMFAAVGNSYTQPNSDQDVMLSYFDINGNVLYTQIYGIPNNQKVSYQEQGFGIAQGLKGDLFITGKTRAQYTNYPNVLWDDVLLFSVTAYNGNLLWAKHYDMPKSMNRGEFGQKVLVKKEELYVSGFYTGYLFNPNGSYDAFVFKTKYNGNPIENRIFGDKDVDYVSTIMNNIKNDGVIAAGFSSSFLGTNRYSPYVIETYDITKKRCHDVITKLPMKEYKLDRTKIRYSKVKTPVEKLPLKEIKMPVDHKVICPKISLPIIPIAKSALNESTNGAEIRVYPTVANTHLNIEGANEGASYAIHSISGKMVTESNWSGAEIDISDLTNGVYILRIENQAIKFIKE